MDDKEYYNQRDLDVMSTLGNIEHIHIFNELDDGRTLYDNPSVLEVGCGSGKEMLRLKDNWRGKNNTELNIKGVDLNEYAISLCKERGLDVQSGDMESLPFEDNCFDIVIAQHSIEHGDTEKAIKELVRVASKKIIIVVPIEAATGEGYTKLQEHKTIVTDNLLSNIFRKIPNERHKIIKEIVKYEQNGITYRNHMIVIYKKENKEEVI